MTTRLLKSVPSLMLYGLTDKYFDAFIVREARECPPWLCSDRVKCGAPRIAYGKNYDPFHFPSRFHIETMAADKRRIRRESEKVAHRTNAYPPRIREARDQ
ncbi:hypothetical protein EVAR_66583_1 [Eumeta japonica]|uniref:Uncharacterized protein n=1 Tax=Eumeta variegata TaxID=151549 RepID=A0A4C1Z8C9_EUMVA|nr:hypothetical protein EVAR_66583_1 [Eumeta japonica]